MHHTEFTSGRPYMQLGEGRIANLSDSVLYILFITRNNMFQTLFLYDT